MPEIINLSIKAKNFKSIGENKEGFESIYPLNIIIGRNNSGKSTLLDLVKFATQNYDINQFGHKGKYPEVVVSKPLPRNEIVAVFPDNVAGGSIVINHREYGLKWEDKIIEIQLQDSTKVFKKIEPEMPEGVEYHHKLALVFENYFEGKTFKRIRADRDIFPEPNSSISVEENGAGATNIIQIYYNESTKNKKLITHNLLSALNKIFNPDVSFTNIEVRRLPNQAFEIFLEEENKGSIALSDSGSGIKTVILVLINILLVPDNDKRPLSEYIFAFEELENNLHSGLQRRLFNYIRDIAIDNNAYFFLTTHSNVGIDFFNKDESAQIIHVTHNGEFCKVRKVLTYIENKGILDDLDVRASDLLQSNGIIWVEGPSDRLYINRLISLFTNDELKENVHYQCVSYGGRLLSHLSALDSDDSNNETVNIIKVNTNAILIMDSDKSEEIEAINSTKQRLINEINSIGGVSWVTLGKEIENYLPKEAINRLYKINNIEQIGKYEDFEEYLDKYIPGEGKKFNKSKVLFAEKVAPYLIKENLDPILDLSSTVEMICNRIRDWNSIRSK